MNKHGGDIYSNPNLLDFSTNINPLGTPDSVIEAAKSALYRSACYPDIMCRDLKASISAFEGINSEWIICGNGAADIIFRLVSAIKPRKALLTAPAFSEYEQALRASDCSVSCYYLQEQDGYCVTERILESIHEGYDMIFLCNPNNPTGETIPSHILMEIIKKTAELNIVLALDECFVDFLDRGNEISVMNHVHGYNNLFIIKAFTKMYAMAGLRLGYGITSNTELLVKMADCAQPWSVSIPAQEAGIAALKETEFVNRTREIIREQREYLSQQLVSMGFQIYGSKANYIFFQSPVELYEALKQHGILIRDCSNYQGLYTNESNYYYRIAVRRRVENERLMKALELVTL